MEIGKLESMDNSSSSPTSKDSPLKSQMTLEQLQKMADRQRQQILRNNQDLIQKQQRLKDMQTGMRRSTSTPQTASKTNIHGTYANKLRESYQNHLSRLRELNSIRGEADSQKFNNIELASELEKVQEIFKEKQKELTIAAAKVDNLTKQLDGRRMGLSNARATPEKLNRRRKIKAAKEELDKLRKELSSRNEINKEQETQLETQKTSLQQKRKELQELDKKINLLGHQLHPSGNDSDASTSSELLNGDVNGNNFGSKHLFDTLQKKKVGNKLLTKDFQVLPDLNRKIIPPTSTPVPYTRRGNFYVAPDGREFDRPPTAEDYPQFKTGSLTNLPSLASPANLPVRSASSDSLSALRGNSPHLPRSRTDVHPQLQVNTSNDQLNSQQRSVAASSFIRSQLSARFAGQPPTSPTLSSIIAVGADSTLPFRNVVDERRKKNELEIWTGSADFRTSSPIAAEKMENAVFSDVSLSGCLDSCSGTVFKYIDSPKSDCTELLVFQKRIGTKQIVVMPDVKHAQEQIENDSKTENEEKPPPLPRKASKPPEVPKKPPVAPKPALPPKKSKQNEQKESENGHSVENEPNFSHTRQPNMIAEDESRQPIYDEDINGDLSSDDFLNGDIGFDGAYDSSTFADIDAISQSQIDLVPYLSKMISDQPYEPVNEPTEEEVSPQGFEVEEVLSPVVISVPPDKMPPTILKKPGRDNKKRGRIQLDPHALLLDAALEGETSLVEDMVHRVPDPSFANAEGITALHNAVCGNHKNVVRLLVEIGCDINSPDNNGWTPLHCAAFYNDVELCTYLVEHGASVFAMTYSDRQTAAEKCSHLEENYEQCFEYLHECKEKIGRINGGEVCSLYEYDAEREDELSFHCGEQLRIVRRGDVNEREWWWAENRRKQAGYVPYNLLGIYPRIAGEV